MVPNQRIDRFQRDGVALGRWWVDGFLDRVSRTEVEAHIRALEGETRPTFAP